MNRGRLTHTCVYLLNHPHYYKLFCPLCYDELSGTLGREVNYFKLYLQKVLLHRKATIHTAVQI